MAMASGYELAMELVDLFAADCFQGGYQRKTTSTE
jgi:hypothetical protein